MQTYDVIVIGAGAAGSSTALAMAKRGKSVLLLEQFSVPHERGSSLGHSRIFRFAYDDTEYAKLAIQALPAWRAIEAESGQSLLHLFGGLDFGSVGNSSFERTAATMTAVGAKFERLDAAATMQKFPQWRIPAHWQSLYSPDAGIVMPSRAVEVMVALACKYGATLLEHCVVQNLSSNTVQTNLGSFQANQIVIAAGAWLPKLVPMLQAQLTVTLEGSLYFAPKNLAAFTPDQFPIFIDHHSLAYGFPVQGLPAVKIGLHQSGDTVDPDTRGLVVPERMIREAQTWLETYLPTEEWRLIQSRTCLYTNTPSHDFILDWHPENNTILLLSPCSGHGFKFASYIGEIAADKLLRQPNPFDLERFRLPNALHKGEAKLLSRAILAPTGSV